MARVTYSALVGSVRGSVGGVTFRGGGVGGVVSARVTGRRSRSAAQDRQRSIISAARRDFDSMEELDRKAFEYAVGEGYEFRPEIGSRFASARAAYAAWYSAVVWTGGYAAVAHESAILRRYGGARDVNATGSASGGISFRFYFPSGYGFAPFAVWMARAKSVERLPSRPVWKLAYSAGFDPPITPEDSGLAAPFDAYAEFGTYVQSRISFFQPGQVIAYRWNGPTRTSGLGPSRVLLMQL